jgi:hypothetical protein
MDRSLLTAFNPTDESLAGRVGWRDFPAPRLNSAAARKDIGEVHPIRRPWIANPHLPVPVSPGGSLKSIRVGSDNPLVPYVELEIG